MKPRAISNTLSFADNFFTPAIVVIPQFSSHEELLLAWVAGQNQAIDQSNIINKSNYIVINQSNENVSIEMVRELTNTLSYGSYEGSERTICLLHADQATLPAQNALLKLLEEPPKGTRLYLSVEDPDKLLETIISRCIVTRINPDRRESDPAKMAEQEQEREQQAALTETIATASYRELIELAEQYKERPEAIELLKKMLAFFHTDLKKNPTHSARLQQINSILGALSGLEKNGNVRLILEDCFFTLKGLK